jgi:outer membrane protein assembly factor BamB
MELLMRGPADVATLLLAALPLAAASCAAASPAPEAPADGGATPRLLWERRITNAPASGLALSGDTLWVTGVDRKISSLDLATGERHWRRSLPVSASGPPLAAGDLLLVPLGGPEPALLALTRGEGKARWLQPLQGAAAGVARDREGEPARDRALGRDGGLASRS